MQMKAEKRSKSLILTFSFIVIIIPLACQFQKKRIIQNLTNPDHANHFHQSSWFDMRSSQRTNADHGVVFSSYNFRILIRVQWSADEFLVDVFLPCFIQHFRWDVQSTQMSVAEFVKLNSTQTSASPAIDNLDFILRFVQVLFDGSV